MLPSFLIIGAMKAGTSSLYRYLDAHPEIAMSRVKETNFFLGDPAVGRDLAWYEALFDGDAKICGEASPNYTKRHLHPGVPARIHALLPDVRLIYLVRDPIERLVSHYSHNVLQRRERRTLAEAIAHPEHSHLVLTSRYFFQLEPFLDRFPQDRILIIAIEDLRIDRRRFFRRIFDFLGVDLDFEDPGFDQIYNSSSEWRRLAFLKRHVPGRRLARFLGRALPSALVEPLLPQGPRLDEADRVRLEEHLAPDVEQLRRFTGQRFERWRL